MVKPAHHRVTWSGVRGSVGAPLDDWSFSINLSADDTFDALAQSGKDTIANSCRTLWQQKVAPFTQLDTILTQTRYASLVAGGKTKVLAGGAFSQGIDETPIAGLVQKTNFPLQLAVVVSLTTERAGPTGKGRYFLPMPAYQPSIDDKRLSLVQAGELRDLSRDLVVGLNGIGSGKVSVVSSKGYLSEVTGVKVGRNIDTLRSRRSEGVEGYLARSLAAS